ncbi:MAG: cytochrome c3 family protein [Magnetococcales bacterium]|nr:cytochrome c3 family protein [Magnetococcales bacterium]
MKYSLQPTGYKESDYERPTPRWVCGRQAQGRPCRRGPDDRGQCSAHGACDPVKRGDRWHCTRPETAGGPCENGPLPDGSCGQPEPPCVPVSSPRAILGRVTWMATGLALAVLLLFLNGSHRLALVAPGDLSPPHAALNSCARCHSAFEGGVANWLVEGMGRVVRGRDSDLCLKCHPRVAQARWPHNLEPSALVRVERGSPTGTDDIQPHPNAHAAPTCSVCHREHTGGTKAPIIRDSMLCNSCHRTTISVFAVDHPEFSASIEEKARDAIGAGAAVGATRDRKSSINFDHSSHFKRHFQGKLKEKAPTRCGQCHTIEAQTGRMLHAGFNGACSSCHIDQIRGEFRAGSKGFPVIGVPGLDTRLLGARSLATGQWPDAAEGEPTPFMRWMLRDDARFNAAWERLKDRDLLELKTLSAEEESAVVDLAWAIKRLLGDLVAGGHAAWAERFFGEGKVPPPGDEWGAINGGLEGDTLKGAVAAWFPDLSAELPRHDQGQRVLFPAPGGVVSRGTGATAGEKPVSRGGDGGGTAVKEEESLLLVDDGAESLLEESPKVAAPEASGETTVAQPKPMIEEEGLLDGESETVREPEGAVVAESSRMLAVNEEEWSRGGGWYRMGYWLYYRPGGHDDEFLRSWWRRLRSMPGAEPLFGMLSAKDAPGVCGKCHMGLRGNQSEAGKEEKVWPDRRLDRHSLTRFSHKPHLDALANNCQECHLLGAADVEGSTAATASFPAPAHGFIPLRKKSCQACHTAQRAGENCLQCHAYHARPHPREMGPEF